MWCSYIAATDTKYCPVKLTKQYINLGVLSKDDFLISKLVKLKKGYRVAGSHKISYTRIREVFLEFTKPFFQNMNLGLHSLRAGGASAAAENHVSDRLISKHGRWSSEKARDGYIQDSVENRLWVSKRVVGI